VGSLDKPRLGADDVKEELRKAGLLSFDSIKSSAASASPSQSLELPSEPSISPPAISPIRRKDRAGVYDAELTVTSSMDITDDIALELGSVDEKSYTLNNDAHSSSLLGRGVSLDFRDSTLSASDRSGELDALMSQVDLLETAEIE
jgi:hypothetical protein